ncbi:MAG: ABC transporter ATP-binding protein [Holophagales bacterium]|nr:MAG: ABC transporter ATP-binding protein [Holophagales bacterium]
MIEFRRFGKRFGAVVAVDALDLRVAPGEVVALLGPNGSGKTTALKAVAGLLRPSSGEVLVDGEPAERPEARRRLSYLPQKVAFPDSLSGEEVLSFYRRLRGVAAERVGEVLRFAALNGAGARAVGTYSGGMTQRLGLAVAMVADSPLLLLDEPTAALDAEGLQAFFGLVERHRRDGRTVLFTSHQLGDVERLVDRFAILVGGRLVASLTSPELATRLADRGALRLRLGREPEGLLEALRSRVPTARREGDELVLPGPAAGRPAVLDEVRRRGGEITGLTTEEGRLDVLFRELVEESRAGKESR